MLTDEHHSELTRASSEFDPLWSSAVHGVFCGFVRVVGRQDILPFLGAKSTPSGYTRKPASVTLRRGSRDAAGYLGLPGDAGVLIRSVPKVVIKHPGNKTKYNFLK